MWNVVLTVADIVRAGEPRRQGDPHLPYLPGEMENTLMTAQVVGEAVIKTTTKAIEASGGFGYLRKSRLEQLFRDNHASQFHPLAEKKQLHFTGRMAMGLDPIETPGNL